MSVHENDDTTDKDCQLNINAVHTLDSCVTNKNNAFVTEVIDGNHISSNETPHSLSTINSISKNADVTSPSEAKKTKGPVSYGNKKDVILMLHKTSDLHCPFVWKPDLLVKIYSDKDIERFSGYKYKEQSEKFGQFKFRGFVINLILCYHRFCQQEFQEAVKYYENLQQMLNDEKILHDDFFSPIMDALTHVIQSCSIYLLRHKEEAEEVTKVLKSIKLYEEMNASNKAAIWAIRASCYVEYGYEGITTAVEYLNRAIDFDRNNAYWYFLKGMYLGRGRRITNSAAVPSREEIKSLEIAISMKEDPTILTFTAEVYMEMADRISKMCAIKQCKNMEENVKELNEKLDEVNKTAISMFKKGVSLDCDNAYLLFRCGKGLMKLSPPYQDLKTAEEFFKKGLLLSPRNSYGNHCMAQYYEKYEKNNQLALKHLFVAVESKNYPAHIDLTRIKFLESRDTELLMKDLVGMLEDYEEVPVRCKILAEIVCYYLFIDCDLVEACFAMRRLLNMNSKFSNKSENFKSSILPLNTEIPLIDILCNDIRSRLSNTSVNACEKIVLEKFISNLCFENTISMPPDKSLSYLKARIIYDLRHILENKYCEDKKEKSNTSKKKKKKKRSNDRILTAKEERKLRKEESKRNKQEVMRRFFLDQWSTRLKSKGNKVSKHVKTRSKKMEDQYNEYEKFQQFVMDLLDVEIKGRSHYYPSFLENETDEDRSNRCKYPEYRNRRSSSESKSSNEDDHQLMKKCENKTKHSPEKDERCRRNEFDFRNCGLQKDRKNLRSKNDKYDWVSQHFGSSDSLTTDDEPTTVIDMSSKKLIKNFNAKQSTISSQHIRDILNKIEEQFGFSDEDCSDSDSDWDAQSDSHSSPEKSEGHSKNSDDGKDCEQSVSSRGSEKCQTETRKWRKDKHRNVEDDRDCSVHSSMRKNKVVGKCKYKRSYNGGSDSDGSLYSVRSRQSRRYEDKYKEINGTHQVNSSDEKDPDRIMSVRSFERPKKSHSKKNKKGSKNVIVDELSTSSESSYSEERSSTKNKLVKKSKDDGCNCKKKLEKWRSSRRYSDSDDDCESVSCFWCRKITHKIQKYRSKRNTTSDDDDRHSISMPMASSRGKIKPSESRKKNIEKCSSYESGDNESDVLSVRSSHENESTKQLKKSRNSSVNVEERLNEKKHLFVDDKDKRSIFQHDMEREKGKNDLDLRTDSDDDVDVKTSEKR